MEGLRGRVMIWAPSGGDGASIAALLERHGIASARCHTARELLGVIGEAGCAVVAQEALCGDNLALIERGLKAQPPWSDFPFVLLAFKPPPGHAASGAWQALGNVAVLERPTRARSLLAAVAAALRARHRQYEAEQAIQHRDQFLAMLGHELRNPLAAISLATEVERQRQSQAASSGRARDVIGVISRQARHLSRLVDDLLDVARVTTGKVVLASAVVDMNEVLERSVQSHEMSAREGQIELVQLPSPVPLPVRGDPVRLEEVLGNLLSNAIKYCPPGARVEASARADGQRCVLSVRDSGVGISAELLPRVFDLFTQAEVSLERSRGGLGVGLTLVKGLAELHGGSVSAHSDGLGKGSCFSVSLPLLEECTEPRAPSSRLLARGPLPPLSVLVVDDNSDLLEMTKELLETLGCDVATAHDGPSGLERLRVLEPQLAFIDIGLPGLDGYQVAREVRSRDARAPRLVALTGYGQPEDRERALAAGFDRHLTKPVSVVTLRQLVEEASRDRQQPPATTPEPCETPWKH